MATSTNRRTYDASRRRAMAEGNRAAVLQAAAELFATRGWATGMRDVAKAATVSVETVYATAGNKAELLLKVIDIGIVGDDEPVPLSDRPEWRALGEGDRTERVAAVARLITTSNQRIAELNRTFAHAASADAVLAERWVDYVTTQREQYAAGTRMVLGRRAPQDVVDGIWALGSAEVYLHLTETAGWSSEKYHHWLAERIDQLLPEEKS
jgi:AcrR family transcriptional regulator